MLQNPYLYGRSIWTKLIKHKDPLKRDALPLTIRLNLKKKRKMSNSMLTRPKISMLGEVYEQVQYKTQAPKKKTPKQFRLHLQ